MAGRNRPRVAVLDYGIGNLRSAVKTLERAGAEPILTASRHAVDQAAGVVLPGVGAFGRVMEAIREAGVDELAHATVRSDKPFLGICVGMQALYEGSEEDVDVEGLGILPGKVRRLSPMVKRPQMQWNRLSFQREVPLFSDIAEGSWVYFVHGFAPEMTSDVVATCEYGGTVVAAAQRGSVVATQFHPEKSGSTGIAIIANFVDICRQAS